MDNTQLKNEIKNIIRESLEHNALRKHVRNVVSEEVHRILKEGTLNEAGDGNSVIKRKAVMNMLKDDKYDHAYLAYQLWHPKATGKPDNNGAVRSFTDEEITKLYELIRKN